MCSGIEAASVAWEPLGWRASFLSEIEAFPRAVLAHRWPGVKCHGDFTTIKAGQYRPIDLLVGGTPCQSFSVAGLRGGLDDDRGNLALEYLRLAQRIKPRWLVWENVPGVLSSNGGRDFGAILGGLVELGYGFAYRVLDAQYVRVDGFGRAVPQRRRRVFVVGYLGDWRRAAAVLFERESLHGHTAPRREAGERAAPTLAARTRGGGGLGTDAELDGALIASDVAPTLNSHFGDKMGLENQHINEGGGSSLPPVSMCLTRGSMQRIDAESETMIPTHGAVFDEPIAFDCKGTEVQFSDDGSHPPLRSMGHNQSYKNAGGHAAVAIQERAICENPNAGPDGAGIRTDGAAYTLEARTVPQAVQYGWRVRRLTPTECERLQGFPDGWTAIPYRNKPADQCPDGPRYKALGNSMAVNVMRWIGQRIEMVEQLEICS